MKPENNFTKKLASILINQARSHSSKIASNYTNSNWSSVRQILGSDEYLKHVEDGEVFSTFESSNDD